MRAERFVISDHSWQILEPHLPGSSRSRGVTAKDSRLFLEAVLWKVRVGVAELWPNVDGAAKSDGLSFGCVEFQVCGGL